MIYLPAHLKNSLIILLLEIPTRVLLCKQFREEDSSSLYAVLMTLRCLVSCAAIKMSR